MPIEVLVAIIALVSAALVAVLGKLTEKFLAKTKEEAEEDDSISSGLRQDLIRKETELSNLKIELKEIDIQLDTYRAAYWALFESFAFLRVSARQVLQTAGWSEEDIEKAIPHLPSVPPGPRS